MRQLQLVAHGEPSDVIALHTVAEPAIGHEDVLVSMEAAPLNPSDFLLVLLEVAFISGRPKETRLALLKELNQRIAAGAGISPDDVMIRLSEGPGENVSFGQGLAQRAFISQAV
jgi:hypothetical protein